MKLIPNGKVRETNWRSFMAKFSTIAKMVGATDIEAYNTLFGAVPTFIKNWIDQYRVSRKYKAPHAHIMVGEGMGTYEISTSVQGWISDKVANVIDLGQGKFDIELRHQEAIEKLVAKRGLVINEDGRKLEVFIPPMGISMTEILEMVAEKLEVQDEKDAEEARRPPRQNLRRVGAAQGSEEGEPKEVQSTKRLIQGQEKGRFV